MIIVGGLLTVLLGLINNLVIIGTQPLLILAMGVAITLLGFFAYRSQGNRSASALSLILSIATFYLAFSGSLLSSGTVLAIFGSALALIGNRAYSLILAVVVTALVLLLKLGVLSSPAITAGNVGTIQGIQSVPTPAQNVGTLAFNSSQSESAWSYPGASKGALFVYTNSSPTLPTMSVLYLIYSDNSSAANAYDQIASQAVSSSSNVQSSHQLTGLQPNTSGYDIVHKNGAEEVVLVALMRNSVVRASLIAYNCSLSACSGSSQPFNQTQALALTEQAVNKLQSSSLA